MSRVGLKLDTKISSKFQHAVAKTAKAVQNVVKNASLFRSNEVMFFFFFLR
jgi:hypothetical protein